MKIKISLTFFCLLTLLFLIIPVQGYSNELGADKNDPNLELRDAVLSNNVLAVKAIFADRGKVGLIKINDKVSTSHFCPGIFLMIACGLGNYEIVNILLEKGANVNTRDEKTGRTALMCAVGAPHPKLEIVRSLIKRGAEVNAKDNNGITVLMYASGAFCEGGCDENYFPRTRALKELLKYQININEKDNNGCTALDYAIRHYSKSQAVTILKSKNAKSYGSK